VTCRERHADGRHSDLANVPSPDDTMKVVKEFEDLTTEAQRLSEQLSKLAREESSPRTSQRRTRHSCPSAAER
jgi:hypothetical protein